MSSHNIAVSSADFKLLVSVFLALPYDQAEEIAADDNDLLPLTGFDDLPSIERESHSQPGDEVDISYREFLNVLLNIGFAAVPGNEYAVQPTDFICGGDQGDFVFNPNASPLDDIAPDEDRRLWCTSLRDRWGLTLASFYQPLVPI